MKNFFYNKRNNLLFRFILKALAIFFIWNYSYEKWIQPAMFIDEAVIKNISDMATLLLKLTGFEVFRSTARLIGIQGTHGIWIGNPCNAISLFALFSGFIIAFPGPGLKKILAIPVGIIIIHFLNILRIYFLLLLEVFAPEVFKFNHTYSFTFLVYSGIFFMWMIWVKKFSNIAEASR